MKKIIFTAAIALAITLTTHAQQFTLSKGVVVGCSGANSLTDLSKNVTVTVEDGKGTMVLKSMNCSKSIEAMSMGVINSSTNGTGYYNTKDGKGFIIENGNKLIVFSGKDGKYEVTGVGHIDKKQAKTLDLTAEQNNYASSFDNFETLLKKAKEEAEKAKMQAKILPIPSGDYSDKYGIGGLYYFSEPALISSRSDEIDEKYAQAVLLHFDESDNFTLKAYITDKHYDKFYFDGSKMFKAFKEGKVSPILMHIHDNMNSIKSFRNVLTRLEEGVYLIGGFVCSEVEKGEIKTHKKTKYPILGKDKNRVEYLMNHPEEVERLGLLAVYSQCKLNDALRAAENPMPVPSEMNTTQLAADATAVTKEFAKGRWAQEVQYSFIIGKEWTTLRNSLTGIITGRIISGVAVMKGSDGSCKWEEISIRQDYDGKNYGKSYFGGESTVIVPVDCSTAMKYKK